MELDVLTKGLPIKQFMKLSGMLKLLDMQSSTLRGELEVRGHCNND